MDKEVLALIIRRDEAEALLVAEPLHGSSCHVFPSREVACCETREVQRATTTNAGTTSPSVLPDLGGQCSFRVPEAPKAVARGDPTTLSPSSVQGLSAVVSARRRTSANGSRRLA